jgi:Fe-S-cluster formation regulator IscX/YfhJ
MIIDAMDILYEGKTDGFCIVSSDSDFTRLAIRLREAGMKVIGMGEQKTPVAFRVACDKFIYIEVIRAAQQDREKAAQPKTAVKKKTKAAPSAKAGTAAKTQEKTENHASPVQEALPAKKGGKVPEEIVKLIADSVSDIADEDGWASMGELGTLLLKKQPDFDPRNFGFTKLTPLIRSLPRFEVDARVVDATKTRHIYLRDKEA